MTGTDRRPRSRGLLGWAMVGLVAIAASACPAVSTSQPEAAGDDVNVERGRELIRHYGCGSCHTVPGVRGADGLVGPPLTRFRDRGFIAGRLTNTPENLARWIADPQGVDPETAMPDLGVSRAQAEDIAAYLHTLDR